MSVIAPRGRHRAPSKLSTTFNSTARVSAAVAVTGGLVASIAAPQAADAATGVASFSGSGHAATTATPVEAVQAKQLLATVDAKPQLATSAEAKQLVVKPKKKAEPKQETQQTQQTAAASTERASAQTQAQTQTQPRAESQTQERSQTQVRPRTSSVSRSQSRPTQAPRNTEYNPAPKAQPKPAPKPKPQPTLPAASGVVAIAKQYVGVPYVWGGNTPAGFDCSGFSSYVFAQAGKSIPRTATAQMFAATKVSSPQPGDLIFYGSSSYAYHVGIYIGGGMMVAAPKPGDVVKIQAVYGNPVAYGRF